jgi:mannose-6-phosphate isomerase
MNRLYPLTFKPIFKDKIWGGQRIRTVLGKDFSPLPNCGEAWLLSGVEGENTVVSNGFLADNELNELVEIYMDDLVGGSVFDKFGELFPLLFKLIDSSDYLSIQVHPGDELAAERHQSAGKTEMWYVIDAEKDAELISGFKQSITRQQFIGHLENRSLREILNVERVKSGDVFYIPAGRVHALGPGILLTEIQQTSDITYRIYDWDRVDPSGARRELHLFQALDAIDFEGHDHYRTHYVKQTNQAVPLVSSPYFTTGLLEVTRPAYMDYEERDSFTVYLCVRGRADLVYRDGRLPLSGGDAVLIPAEIPDCRILPAPSASLLEIYIEL